MKIKIKKIVSQIVEKEIDVGRRGGSILVRTSSDYYRLGKLEKVVKTPKSDDVFGNKNEDYLLKFLGESYKLSFSDGQFPIFIRVKPTDQLESYAHIPEFLSLRYVDSVYVGFDEITSHLDSVDGGKYKCHADVIRRTAKGRRRRK